MLKDIYATVRDNATLFLGLLLVSSGMLNFRSSRYCEGTTADYFACTNPATYYYYPGTAIFAVVFGILLLALWKVHKRAGG
jgi:uncharacterized membrane protein YphA (DoxX/SURF4 family)